MSQEKPVSYNDLEALYVHSMGTNAEGELHERAMSIVWAAVYWAFQQYAENPTKVPELVFASNHFWGDKELLPLGLQAAMAAIKELEAAHIPAKVTYVANWHDDNEKPQDVFDTSTELKAFLEWAKKNDKKKVGSMSSRTHLKSIHALAEKYKSDDTTYETIPAEETLLSIKGDIGHAAYTQKVVDILTSEDEAGFQDQEFKKNLILKIPFGDAVLRMLAGRSRKISSQGRESFEYVTLAARSSKVGQPALPESTPAQLPPQITAVQA